MDVQTFDVEAWMNEHEEHARYNIAETCVDSLTLDELMAIGGTTAAAFFGALGDRRLTYGDIEGSPAFRDLVSHLYERRPRVLAAGGAIGANFLVFLALVRPGDRVVAVHPTYQQLYEVPRALGARVEFLYLRRENGYLPDLHELRALAAGGLRMIVLNNPNNPTGALMPRPMLEEIAGIARSAGAYVLCDEVYRDLLQPGVPSAPSMVDLYENAIATGSMSKTFSLAGLRLGWIAGPDDVIGEAMRRRDYTTISCGMLDDALAVLALSHREAIMRRSLAVVHGNLEILDRWVEAEPAVSYVRPTAGTTALLEIDGGMASRALCETLMAQRGTLLVPGDCFGMEGTARVGFANRRETLEAGLEEVSRHLGRVPDRAHSPA